MKRIYSTAQVARILGMPQPDLQRAIRKGKLKPPPLVKVGALPVRLWSVAEVGRARRTLGR
jgi:hypothetical protein